jgi:peptide-methionine (S)-S-oxide reductase
MTAIRLFRVKTPLKTQFRRMGHSNTNGVATFGAGCFWGSEKFFRHEFAGKGLVDAKVGYMGGTMINPSYEDVCTGRTGHAEVVQITYEAPKLDYKNLVRFFFRFHDPTTPNRQGNDVGTQYRSVVFYHDEEQRQQAQQVIMEAQKKWASPITTTLEPASTFYEAEKYHQKYLELNPGGYCNHSLRY